MLQFSASLCRQSTTSIINDEKLSEVNLSFCQSYTKLVKFEILLVSKFYNPSTYIYRELPQNKTDDLCLDISGFVVVLSFGDSEGVD